MLASFLSESSLWRRHYLIRPRGGAVRMVLPKLHSVLDKSSWVDLNNRQLLFYLSRPCQICLGDPVQFWQPMLAFFLSESSLWRRHYLSRPCGGAVRMVLPKLHSVLDKSGRVGLNNRQFLFYLSRPCQICLRNTSNRVDADKTQTFVI